MAKWVVSNMADARILQNSQHQMMTNWTDIACGLQCYQVLAPLQRAGSPRVVSGWESLLKLPLVMGIKNNSDISSVKSSHHSKSHTASVTVWLICWRGFNLSFPPASFNNHTNTLKQETHWHFVFSNPNRLKATLKFHVMAFFIIKYEVLVLTNFFTPVGCNKAAHCVFNLQCTI